ncbi:MAG: lycopene cyclase domain-containing protein [Candidatus Woesearchaeota archaeon]
MLQYSYFIGVLVMLLIWGVMFYLREDLRKLMFISSLVCGVFGFFGALVYNQDWWLPLTLTHTFVGIEDFLFAFTLFGIAGFIGFHLYKFKLPKKINYEKLIKKVLFVSLVYYILLVLLYFLGVHSFYGSLIGGLLIYFYIVIKNNSLIKYSLISGLVVVILLLPAYLIPELLNPGWLKDAWMLENLTGLTFLGIVIEDVIWVYAAGICCSALLKWLID